MFDEAAREYIFTEIKAKNKDIRFTTEEALQRFSAIYSNIPTNAREKEFMKIANGIKYIVNIEKNR